MKRRDVLVLQIINIQSSVIKFELWLTDILVVMTDLSTDTWPHAAVYRTINLPSCIYITAEK